MISNRIGIKLGAWIIVLFAVVILTLGLVMDRLFSGFFYNQMREEAEELASHFSKMAESHGTGADQMLQTFAEFSNVNIYMFNHQGQTIAASGHLPIEEEPFFTGNEFNLVSQGENLGKPYEDRQGNRYYVSGRLIRGGIHASDIIFVVSSLQSMDKSVARVRNLLFFSGMGAFLLAAAFTYMVSTILSRPLLQMEQATRKIAKGELETRLAITSNDELGTLAVSINDLAQELQLYRDNRQEFFANISHELRTPVTYLEGYTKVLQNELYESEEEKKQYLDIIYQESIRLRHLLLDLFELAKMEEGHYALALEWIDLGELIESAVQKVQLKARSKGIEIHVEVREDAERLYADGYRMEQVLLNLLENAIRYTEQGHIKVSVHKEAEFWLLEVKDTGIGIPQDEIPFIFDRFYRVEKSRSRQHGGTGLGLAIVKKLVELQGGTIAVESEAGQGTVFKVRFKSE